MYSEGTHGFNGYLASRYYQIALAILLRGENNTRY